MKFRLEIELGNDAMITGAHVAACLLQQADLLATRSGDWPLDVGDTKQISDGNGNRVGGWKVSPDRKPRGK